MGWLWYDAALWWPHQNTEEVLLAGLDGQTGGTAELTCHCLVIFIESGTEMAKSVKRS